MNRNADFNATVELDTKLNQVISSITQKYGVKVNVDSDYSKGTIRIKIKN